MGKGNESQIEIIYCGEFEYKTPSVSSKISAGRCGMDIVRFDNGVCCVIMTEIKHRKNISITNVCDRIATQAYEKYLSGFNPDRIVWLEHHSAGRAHKAHIDLIQFHHAVLPAEHAQASGAGKKGYVFTQPRWKRFIESRVIDNMEFLNEYSHILKEFCNATLIFSADDKVNYQWCVWAVADGFFMVSANPSVLLPKYVLDAPGVCQALKDNQRFFEYSADIAEMFTEALVKGFLYKGL